MKKNYKLYLLKLISVLSLVLYSISYKSQVGTYTFSQSTATYTEISGGTNLFTTNWDNNVSSALPIGFTFNFNGQDFTNCYVSSNGFLTFGSDAENNDYYPISGTDTYIGSVSGLGRNLTNNGRSLSYTTTGVSPNRVFIVQWKDARRYDGNNIRNGNFNFQIKLYETTNKVEVHYGVCATNDITSLPVQVGLRGSTNTDYNNRRINSVGNWSSTISGNANNSSLPTSQSYLPTPNIQFIWSPPTCKQPSNVTAYNIGVNSASVSWTAPSPVPSQGYDVYITTSTTPPIASTPPTWSFLNSVNAINITGLNASTTYYVWVRSKCSGTSFSYWTLVSFTTYCGPSTTTDPSDAYITSVEFLGTMNDVSNTSTYSTTTPGYQDFTNLPNKAVQAAGEGMNIRVAGNDTSKFKAWIDWNKNGIFNAGELVYESVNPISGVDVGLISTRFGVVIPAGTAPGDYTLRIRNYRYYDYWEGEYSWDYDYDACEVFNGGVYPEYGEAEDYTFRVVANCNAMITSVTDGQNCKPSAAAVPVTVTATGNAATTSYNWYNAEIGGSLVTTTATGSYTPNLTTTTVYWVAAATATCISPKRVKVVATVSPSPTITFNSSSAAICGQTTPSVVLTAAGDKETVTILEEKFNSGLGAFVTTINTNTSWSNQASVYIPDNTAVWRPAIGSLYQGNFAYITSDFQTNTYEAALSTNSSYDTSGYESLNLDFEVFYSYYGGTESFNIEASTNGTTWQNVQTYTSSMGMGTKFQQVTLNLNAFVNQPTLYLRFRYASGWSDGVAIDNIKIYGERPLAANFNWTGGGIFAANCVDPYNGASSSVCINPTATQIISNSTINITASATLSNGCSATGTYSITNNNKTWNNLATITDWASSNWRPGSAPPTSDNCVNVRTPLIINSGTDAVAKNITIETNTSASATIRSGASLTVTEEFVNKNTQDRFVIESDANFIQINDTPSIPNSGSATAKRRINFRNSDRVEYNYLISPVIGQSLKTIYPGVPTTSTYPYVLYFLESTGFFGNSSGAYVPGRGLGVKEPLATHVPAAFIDAEFKGQPANGVINFSMAFTNNTVRGYNLVGNPYPSNINLQTLYNLNGGQTATPKIGSTFYFWDNRANDVAGQTQQGVAYNGRAYAVYNAANDTGNEAGYLLSGNPIIGSRKPNKIAKVGQGFMVRANSKTNFTYNNSIRTNETANSNFFSKSAVKDRYWVKMISPLQGVNTIAVVYYEGGKDSFGHDDSELNQTSSDMFYTIKEDRKLLIEGKPLFVDTDKVLIGSKHFEAGSYTISLGEREGIFNGSQNIYLKDKQTGMLTNLSNGDYTFTASAGDITNRFEIVYKEESVLGVDESASKDRIVVYKDAKDFVVKSTDENISEISIFDTSGRLVKVVKGNEREVRFTIDTFADGMYLLNIKTENQVVSRRIIK